MKDSDIKNDNGGVWINIYKLPDKEIYWSGSVGHSTKEMAQYNNAGEYYRIATLNIKEVLNQQSEIKRLRKALDKILNYNSVKEQTDKYYHIVMDVREIAKMALNGESEER